MTELLSPAGSDEALIAAVMSGADAVYAGGDKFSARAGAKNLADMRAAAEYCHKYGVKIYAAVNTLIKENELDELAAYALYLNECGVDGVIIQDAGAAVVFQNIVPALERHASTQMTASDKFDVQYLNTRGFKRVVISRELSRAEIADIRRHTKAELEMFVHGAICMCYSGQCLMSSIIGGRSGNRGRCAQPCRKSYRLLENGKEVADCYALSPKDMALIDYVSELDAMGINSLKIEGRLKRAEYVAAVTGVYRRCLDEHRKSTKCDMAELTNAFSRSGFTDGYFTGKLGANMMCHTDPSNSAANSFTDEAKRRAAGFGREIDIDMQCIIAAGEPVRLFANDGGHYIEVSSDTLAETAKTKPTDPERVRAQLAKLGGTGYRAANIDVMTDSSAAVPISGINALRREAVRELDAARTAVVPCEVFGYNPHIDYTRDKRTPSIAADVLTREQADAAARCGVARIFAYPRLAAELARDYPELEIITKIGPEHKPDVITDAVEISTAGGISRYKGKRIIGGVRLNITNSLAAEFYSELDEITLSAELNSAEVRSCITRICAKTGIIAYGRLELMVMRNCPVKALGKCAKHGAKFSLKDGHGEEFPLICSETCTGTCSDWCMARLLNSKPIYMADKAAELLSMNADIWRLVFTTESGIETARIIENYRTALTGENAAKMRENTFTRGHYTRGVL